MAVEARFKCVRKDVVDQVSAFVRLEASTEGRDNTEWAPYTPSGAMEMTITGAAAGEFVQDGRYRITLERVGPGE